MRGPGCFVCPWAAARPRAVRAASFARRVVSKPGQAPPPPTGTAARPSGPSGALHTSGTWCADWWFGASSRSPARPRRRPRAPQPGPPDPPAPSTPVGPSWLMLRGALPRSPTRPRRRRPAPRPDPASKPARALRSLRRPPHRRRLACWRVDWRVVSKPGQAPPPPTGTAARALRTLRRPPHRWCRVAVNSPAKPRRRPPAPRSGLPSPVGITGASRAAISGRSFACCYKRRQSEVFFVWISDPLLQMSSIRRLFR